MIWDIKKTYVENVIWRVVGKSKRAGLVDNEEIFVCEFQERTLGLAAAAKTSDLLSACCWAKVGILHKLLILNLNLNLKR